MRNPGRSRRPVPTGFTLAEMLVVVVIVLLLAAAVVPVALSLANGRALREAASTLQASIAGARDRATSYAIPEGIRLIPDNLDPSIVRELRYIRQAKPVVTGSAIVVDAAFAAPWDNYVTGYPIGATVPPKIPASSWPAGGTGLKGPLSLVALLGAGDDAFRLSNLPYRLVGTAPVSDVPANRVYFGSIRLGSAGQLLGFTTSDALLNATYPLLRLDAPLPRPVPFDFLVDKQLPYSDASTWSTGLNALAGVGISYNIALGNTEAEGETPILLPAGVRIDLGYIDPSGVNPPDPSGVRLSRLQPESRNWDIMFAPSGSVIGAAASDSYIFLWLREDLAATEDVAVKPAVAPSGYIRLIPTTNTGNHAIVAISTPNGRVSSVEPNFGADASAAGSATVDVTLATGSGNPYWNPNTLYDLFFNSLLAANGGETGL